MARWKRVPFKVGPGKRGSSFFVEKREKGK